MTDVVQGYDSGPYESPDQVLRQFNRATFGQPLDVPTVRLLDLVLGEALELAGVVASDFEVDCVREFNEQVGLDPVTTQILAAWLLRAHHAGVAEGQEMGAER